MPLRHGLDRADRQFLQCPIGQQAPAIGTEEARLIGQRKSSLVSLQTGTVDEVQSRGIGRPPGFLGDFRLGRGCRETAVVRRARTSRERSANDRAPRDGMHHSSLASAGSLGVLDRQALRGSVLILGAFSKGVGEPLLLPGAGSHQLACRPRSWSARERREGPR